MSNNLISDLTQINIIKQNIKSAIENKGQTVTNFNSYSGAIENIVAGSGDIALYENISDMQSNTANDGDLALVYNVANLQGLYQYNSNSNNWEVATTGLTATNEYINAGKFIGASGVQTGTLQVNTNLSIDQAKIKTQIYNDLSYLELNDSVTSLLNTFRGYTLLVNVPEFNTSNVTSMANMFFNCYNLTSIPNFDTSNVTNMFGMFANCYNLTEIPNFDTSNVTNMRSIFYRCSNLINIPNLNISNVTTTYMMFYNCYNLTSIPNFDTSNVTDMHGMFLDCYNLTEIPNFDTSKVTNMGRMFANCVNLVNIPNFDTSNVTSMNNMFYNCYNLSNDSIANIVNSMPIAANLTNQYFNNIGININRLDNDQLIILNNLGYIDCIPLATSTTYNITYTI